MTVSRGLALVLLAVFGGFAAYVSSGWGDARAVGPGAIRDGFESTTLDRNDDESTGLVDFGFTIDFFGVTRTAGYINNNGNITLDAPLRTYTPFRLSTTNRQIIAPFFADVDTRSEGEPARFGQGTVGGRPAFGATWRDVDCYNAFGTSNVGNNYFQVVLVERSDTGPGNFDIEFNYDQIAWETGTASGGTSLCLGGSSVRVGWSNGTTTSFELPGSAVPGAFLDSGPAATRLTGNSLNSGDQLGRYVFQVRGGRPIEADLSVSKSATPEQVRNGASITYTVAVANAGPDEAHNVTLIDALADGLTFESGDERCDVEAGVVACVLGTIRMDAPTTVSFAVSVDTTGSNVTNTVEVSADEPDPNSNDNAASITVGVLHDAPPTARFSFSPAEPIEGSPVQLTDESYDVDEDDSITGWRWVIEGPGLGQLVSDQRNPPPFIPPDSGVFVVTLEVTASNGVTDSAVSGGSANDGTAIPRLDVANAPPLPNALNVDVLEGHDLRLAGRFIDAGWLDTHAARWEVVTGQGEGGAGQPESLVIEDEEVQEEHKPALGTGFVDGVVPADALAGLQAGYVVGGVLRVSDGAASTDDLFTVSVVADDPERHEQHGTSLSNDSIPDAFTLLSDGAYLSYIQQAGDIDVFEVRWRGAGAGESNLGPQDLPPGSEVLVTLRDLPADFDLVVLTRQPPTAPFQLSPFQLSPFQLSPFQLSPYQLSPFQLSPFQLSPYQLSPFQLSPYQLSPFQLSPYQLSPYQLSPFQLSPYQLSPYQLSPYQLSPFQLSPYSLSPYSLSPYQLSPFQLSPLSQMGFTGLSGDGIGGVDIDLSELGLGDLGPGTGLAGLSANRGTGSEAVLVRVDTPGTRVFAAIVGANRAHSSEPYTLQVETSVPFEQVLLAADVFSDPEFLAHIGVLCTGTPLVGSTGSTESSTLYAADNPSTLVITQRERMIAQYGGEAWDDLAGKLLLLADHDRVNAQLLSLPSAIFDDWDRSPCSVEAANEVSDRVRSEIEYRLDTYPSIRNVVMVGGDQIVPFRRVADETVISNERYYTMTALLHPGSPIFSSIAQGYNLTDDFYVDREPSPWQGRALFVPDLAVGRLVETPVEIGAAATAFLDSDGMLNAATALVSGYDFFRDGAHAMADNLQLSLGGTLGGPVSRMIDAPWDADELRCRLLGAGEECSSPDVAGINAHYTHYAALTAAGFSTHTDDILLSVDVAGAGVGTPALLRTLVFTMGCHAGLSVPDGTALPVDLGLGVDPQLDFAQAMARQRAIFIASTGYGLGDDVGIGGTERLLTILSTEIGREGASIGDALRSAKHAYFAGLGSTTVYDEKSSIQTTLYGLPMYRIGGGEPHQSLQASSPEPGELGDTSTRSFDPTLVETPSGDYFTVDGDAQSTAGRPIQPRVVIDVPRDPAGTLLHGTLLTGGAFTDREGFDPVIVRPRIEWEGETPEPRFCLPSFWPSELATINTLGSGDSASQTLVLSPGQFRCTSDPGATVTGTQRVFSSLTFDLLRSGSTDRDPPQVTGLNVASNPGGGIDVRVTANDPGGIGRIVVLRIADGVMHPYHGDGAGAESGEFIVGVPDYQGADSFLVQVADGAGNVAVRTGKGAYVHLIAVAPPEGQTVDEGELATLRATVFDYASLAADPRNMPLLFLWSLGDGITVGGELSESSPSIVQWDLDDETGDLTFEVSHRYRDDDPGGTTQDTYTAELLMNDFGGGTGSATTTVTVRNVAPVVTSAVFASPVKEGETASLHVEFDDPGGLDAHTVVIDWGDGATSTLVLPVGSRSFEIEHQYLDDGPSPGNGTPMDAHAVLITIVDDDGGTGAADSQITVSNVPPVAGPINPDGGKAAAMVPVPFTVAFTDAGTLDLHRVVFDWGDGTATTSATVTRAPGSGTATASHAYAGPGAYSISVVIYDDDTGSADATTSIEILTARATKLLAVEALGPYEGEHRKIAEAVDALRSSLDQQLWLDDLHLELKHGHRVFSDEKHAVVMLLGLIVTGPADGESDRAVLGPAAGSAAEDAVAWATAADRLIAVVQLDAARSRPPLDPRRKSQADRRIADAEEQIARGDLLQQARRPGEAIDRYRQAWEQANLALTELAKRPGQGRDSVDD